MDEPRADAWIRRALSEVLAVWGSRGVAYTRHLRALGLPRDALGDLLTLAARRVVPLEPAVHRPLPVGDLDAVDRALLRLPLADRLVLLESATSAAAPAGADAADGDGPRREHLAAALWRLVHETHTVRRSSDAPWQGP